MTCRWPPPGWLCANFFGARLGDRLLVTAVHLVFAGLVVGALVLALRRLGRGFLRDYGPDSVGSCDRGDLIAELLAVAIAINLLAYVLLYPGSTATVREVAPIFGLGGALAGRVMAEPLLRRRLERLLAIGAVAAIAVLVAALVAVKPQPPASANLARFLEAHHLRNGLAGYWNANSTNVDSLGQIDIRTVKFRPGHGLGGYKWELDIRQLDSRGNDANFLVATAPGLQKGATVTSAEAVAQFGKPYRQYDYEGYVIMVWRKNLLTELGSPFVNA